MTNKEYYKGKLEVALNYDTLDVLSIYYVPREGERYLVDIIWRTDPDVTCFEEMDKWLVSEWQENKYNALIKEMLNET